MTQDVIMGRVPSIRERRRDALAGPSREPAPSTAEGDLPFSMSSVIKEPKNSRSFDSAPARPATLTPTSAKSPQQSQRRRLLGAPRVSGSEKLRGRFAQDDSMKIPPVMNNPK